MRIFAFFLKAVIGLLGWVALTIIFKIKAVSKFLSFDAVAD